MEANVEVKVEAEKKPSLFGIITSPIIQFQRMKEKVPIGFPLIMMMLIMVMTGAMTAYISLNNPIMKNLNSAVGFKIPASVTIGIGALGGLVSGTITFYIMAGIYKIFMMLVGNDTTYRKLVSIVIYTSIISYLGVLVNCLLALALKGYEPIYTSLVPLVGNNKILKAIAGNFDLFQIWHYIVLALGLHIAAGLSKNKAIALIVIFFFLGIGFTYVGTLLPQGQGM